MASRWRARLSRAGLRKAVFVVHLWIGLSIGLLFAVVSASGSAIVFRRELDGVARPELAHVAAAPGAPALPLAALREAILREHPEAGPSDANLFVYQPWDGAALTTFVAGKSYAIDPYTGRTLATMTGGTTLAGWAKDLHTDLLKGDPGKGLNGWGAVIASVLLLSGLWLWWPATRKQIRLRLTVRRRVSLRRTVYDLHNVLGFYSLALLLVVTLTGVGLCFNKPLNAFVRAKLGGPRSRPAPIVPSGARLDPDLLLATARREVPNARFVTVTLPTKPAQPFVAMMQRTGAGFFPYVSLRLDPYTGRVVAREDDATDPIDRKIMRQVAVLHFGTWGSLGSKLLYVLLGLVPLGLYVTGVVLWWNRLRAKRDSDRRRAARSATSADAPSRQSDSIS